jgi:hypothetical protein
MVRNRIQDLISLRIPGLERRNISDIQIIYERDCPGAIKEVFVTKQGESVAEEWICHDDPAGEFWGPWNLFG